MRAVLALLIASPALLLAGPALAGTADCLWRALPPSREALKDLDPEPPSKDWQAAASRILPQLALEEAAYRCGSESSKMDALAVLMIEKQAVRLRAERSLSRYRPSDLVRAFDWPAVMAAAEARFRSDGKDDTAMQQAWLRFEKRLPLPPTEAEQPYLAAWFRNAGQERLLEDMWRLSVGEGPLVEPGPLPPIAQRRRDRQLAASRPRPAWEQGDLSACAWSKLAKGKERLLYVSPLNAGMALDEGPAFEIASALRACGGAVSPASRKDLADYVGVRAGERAVADRFDPLRLDTAFASLTPAEQIEQVTMKGGLQNVGPALKRFRTSLGLEPQTDLNHGSPEDDAINGYFMARSLLAAHRAKR